MQFFDNQEIIQEQCAALLSDESKTTGGIPSKVFFPESVDDLRTIMISASNEHQRIRFIGNHTGTTGGAVPLDNEWALSFSRMNRILSVTRTANDEIILICEPGITLSSINQFLQEPSSWPDHVPGREHLSRSSHFYAPDPTETEAQLGGTVATNASGARSLRFGATRNSIHSLSIVTASGDTFTIDRSVQILPEKGFCIVTDQKNNITIPPFTFKSLSIKNASGFYAQSPMDCIDLFIGSEGLLGAFSSISIKLQKSMQIVAGCSFFTSRESAFGFADFLRNENQIVSLELFDSSALQFIGHYRKQFPESLPQFPAGASQAILWEFADNTPQSFESRFDLWESILDKYGSSFERTWSGVDPHEIDRLKKFRHALPETVNSMIASYKRTCPSIRKIGTDTALPEDRFLSVYNKYLSLITESNLAHAAFGHLGDYHIHINLLPSNEFELKQALDIYDQMMSLTIENNGSVSAEHGIGKVKKKYLIKMYGDAIISQMNAIKKAFDPEWRLNFGTMLDCGNLQ